MKTSNPDSVRLWWRAASIVVVLALSTVVLVGCSGDDDDDDGLVGGEQMKPTFEWGYPEYSEYDSDGAHVGQTIYQTDPACQERLTFYECDFVNAMTPQDGSANPTGASSTLTGGDSCTSAIVDSEPSYCIPADVCNPTQQPAAWAPGQASSDNLAWQLFIAVNWPADPDEPGYPDPSSELGALDSDGDSHAKTVWLDYPTPEDVFGVPSPCGDEAESLQMSSKVSDVFLSKLPPLGAIGPLGGSIEAGGGTLIDQNGKIVYDDIRVNRTEWEFIVNQNDYWQTGSSLDDLTPGLTRDYSAAPGQTAGAFPAASTGDFSPADIGSMEIKASWKQLSEDEIAGGTFYTRSFTVYDPDAPAGEECQAETTMGLVGMHIVYQPALFGNPEWVWASFEHVGNVPTAGINDGATSFSFNDPDCTPVKSAAECEDFDSSEDDRSEFRCCPNLKLYASTDEVPDEDAIPTQVTRLTDPSVSTVLPTDCTEYYLDAIDTHFGSDNVWKNYFLVSTQWPLRGSSTNFPFYEPSVEATFPCTMRNTMMETFSVASAMPASNGCSLNADNPFCRACNGDCVATEEEAMTPCTDDAETPTQFVTASCIGCHTMYAGQNSSFIFGHRPCCVRSDATYPNDCGNILNEGDCTADTACEWVSTDPGCG